MSYDEKLAERVRAALIRRPGVTERRMFGGLAFLLYGRMFCGILENDWVARVGPDRYEEALRQPHVRPMDLTGRPMREYLYVTPTGQRNREAVGKVDRARSRFRFFADEHQAAQEATTAIDSGRPAPVNDRWRRCGSRVLKTAQLRGTRCRDALPEEKKGQDPGKGLPHSS